MARDRAVADAADALHRARAEYLRAVAVEDAGFRAGRVPARAASPAAWRAVCECERRLREAEKKRLAAQRLT